MNFRSSKFLFYSFNFEQFVLKFFFSVLDVIFNMGLHIKNSGDQRVKMFKNKLFKIESINKNSEEWKFKKKPSTIYPCLNHLILLNIDSVTRLQKLAFKL